MGPETRQRALEKLAKFRPKIGYPDKWRDYSRSRDQARRPPGQCPPSPRRSRSPATWPSSGKPVDRDEWFMTPQTVNAYYNAGMNEIVFPAAILQPPFFDMEADDAVNYGGIGAVIGHEIGHGFDDQGSKSDGDGNMVSWWTDADRKQFEARTKMLIDQYSQFAPAQLPGQKVNGALTIGENIGDLGGLSIAYKAYHRSLKGREAPVIDGLTGDQRFFTGLGPGLADQVPRRRAGAPARHRSALARRVPLQRRAPEPARVLLGLRRQGGRQALAARRAAGADLVKSISHPRTEPVLELSCPSRLLPFSRSGIRLHDAVTSPVTVAVRFWAR